MVIIREMLPKDIEAVARIHHEAFSNDCETYGQSYQWIQSKYLCWPITKYFVAICKEEIMGYILWLEMGGFRKQCVLELEQLAVAKRWQANGIGRRLIIETLPEVHSSIRNQGRILKLIEVTTGTSNEVQKLYKNTLGAEFECEKRNFFDENEVVLIARPSEIENAMLNNNVTCLNINGI